MLDASEMLRRCLSKDCVGRKTCDLGIQSGEAKTRPRGQEVRLVAGCAPTCETSLKEQFLYAASWVAQQACGRWHNMSLLFGTSKDFEVPSVLLQYRSHCEGRLTLQEEHAW